MILGENMVPLLAYFIDLFIIHFFKNEIKRFINYLVFVQILGLDRPNMTKYQIWTKLWYQSLFGENCSKTKYDQIPNMDQTLVPNFVWSWVHICFCFWYLVVSPKVKNCLNFE